MGRTGDRFDFENLDVFEVAIQAVVVIDALVEQLPEGRAYIKDQLRREANSMPLNIAEGVGEFQPQEKARFYRIARRSGTEAAAQLIVCRRLGLLDAPRIEEVLGLLRRVVAMLVTLVRRCGERDGTRIAQENEA